VESHSSNRSSDISIITSIDQPTSPCPCGLLRHSTSFNSDHDSVDDLDIEDLLNRVYVHEDEFEWFSKTEVAFIGPSVVVVFDCESDSDIFLMMGLI
jgi:hypothetical protein